MLASASVLGLFPRRVRCPSPECTGVRAEQRALLLFAQYTELPFVRRPPRSVQKRGRQATGRTRYDFLFYSGCRQRTFSCSILVLHRTIRVAMPSVLSNTCMCVHRSSPAARSWRQWWSQWYSVQGRTRRTEDCTHEATMETGDFP